MADETNLPIAAAPRCDVPGCGMLATRRSTGKEKDVQGLNRLALPNINLCGDRHSNWPHSEDARTFAAMSAEYKARK